MPLLCEFYCLSGLTNSYLTKNLTKMPIKTFPTLLGFQYDILEEKLINNKNLNLSNEEVFQDWIEDDIEDDPLTGEENIDEFFEEEEMDEFDSDHDFEEEDLEEDFFTDSDSLMYSRLFTTNEYYNYLLSPLAKEKLFPAFSTLTNSSEHKIDELFLLRQKFPEFFQLQNISLDLQLQYKKVPLFFRYLKAKKEISKSINTEKNNFLQNYSTIETKLWTKTKLNLDILRLPTNTPWYNSEVPTLYDNLFLEYEEFSELLNENEAEEDDGNYDEDDDSIFIEHETAQFEIFGNQSENLNEPGTGDEYIAPNWFWISFFFIQLFFGLF